MQNSRENCLEVNLVQFRKSKQPAFPKNLVPVQRVHANCFFKAALEHFGVPSGSMSLIFFLISSC